MLPWNRLLALLLLFFVSPAAFAQSAPAADKTKWSVDQEPAVIESAITHIDYQADGTAKQNTTARLRIQTELGAQRWGVLRFSYAKAVATFHVDYVRVRKADGSTVITPEENIQDMPAEITRAAPFYSDLREVQVAVKGVGPGAILEFRTSEDLTSPLAPGHFWLAWKFTKDVVSLDEQLQVSFPADKYVKVKSDVVKPVISEAAGRRTYLWKTSNPKPDKEKPPVIGKVPAPTLLWTTFHDWNEVGRWYAGLQADRVVPSPEVRAKALVLTKDAKSDADKARAIYAYVSTHFRYIGVAFGIGRYQPHSSGDILSNEYGDCKDKHTLLAAMLKAVGLTAYPALVNSSTLIDPDVPTPGQFDHVISVVPLGKDLAWVDTTPEVAPFGLLLRNIRGKQALLIPDEAAPHLAETPGTVPFRTFQEWDVTGKLAPNGTLEADIKVTFRGDSEVGLRSAFRRASQSQWQEVAQAVSYVAGFGGTVSDVTVSPPDNTAEPFTYSYHYTRTDFPDWANHTVADALPPVGLPLWNEEDKDRPIELTKGTELLYRSSIQVPSGYVPELPAPFDVSTKYVEYHSSHSFKDGALVSERRAAVKVDEVGLEQRDDYVAVQKLVSDDESRLVSFNTATVASVESPRKSEGRKDQSIDELYQSAIAAIKRQDYKTALPMLKTVVAKSPNHQDAWYDLGHVYSRLGDRDAAIAAFRKQVEVNPSNQWTYNDLGVELEAQTKFDEAASAFRKQLDLNPLDPSARKNLAMLLIYLRRYKEAVPELEAAVKVRPDDTNLARTLALVLSHMSRSDSYSTALGDQIIPAATLRDAQSVVDNIGTGFDSGNLALGKPEAFSAMHELALAWARIGWAKFLGGDKLEALRYLKAAFSLSQSGTVANRLARWYEDAGQKAEAKHMLGLAVVAGGAEDGESRSRLIQLSGERAAAQEIEDAGAELSRLRSVKLPLLSKSSASAEVDLMFDGSSTPEQVAFVSGDEVLRGSVKALATISYPVDFPDASRAKIVRRAAVSCALSQCLLVLMPLENVAPAVPSGPAVTSSSQDH